MDCGEGVDSAALRLPDEQHSLFAKVRAAAKTLVTVLIVGRPYAVPEIAEGSDALMVAFYPGPWGGQALAEALLGRFSRRDDCPSPFPGIRASCRCTITPRGARFRGAMST